MRLRHSRLAIQADEFKGGRVLRHHEDGPVGMLGVPSGKLMIAMGVVRGRSGAIPHLASAQVYSRAPGNLTAQFRM